MCFCLAHHARAGCVAIRNHVPFVPVRRDIQLLSCFISFFCRLLKRGGKGRDQKGGRGPLRASVSQIFKQCVAAKASRTTGRFQRTFRIMAPLTISAGCDTGRPGATPVASPAALSMTLWRTGHRHRDVVTALGFSHQKRVSRAKHNSKPCQCSAAFCVCRLPTECTERPWGSISCGLAAGPPPKPVRRFRITLCWTAPEWPRRRCCTSHRRCPKRHCYCW